MKQDKHLLVKIKNNDAKEKQVQGALNIGNWVSIVLTAISCLVLVKFMLPETMKMEFFGEGLKDISSMRVFYASLIGLFVGGTISSVTEYYTGLGTKPGACFNFSTMAFSSADKCCGVHTFTYTSWSPF